MIIRRNTKRAAGKSGSSQELAFFYKPMDKYFVSRYGSIPSEPPSRPMPLSFIPPNGA
ncbi:hypothetical protein I653_01990 [Bacillus subtilis subsp. subtilis str. BAB-1]|nr:hypothetical protein I653_01990 [Bacillus subtilis subsp. subtilis str. BAB-1]